MYRHQQQWGIRSRYAYPQVPPQPRVNYNEGKTLIRATVRDRTDEEMTPAEYYDFMIEDEQNLPNLRLYNERIQHMEEAVNVFKFYFKDCYQRLEQRKQTCHLAMTYFTETIMR